MLQREHCTPPILVQSANRAQVVGLKRRALLEAANYPSWTLVRQAVGSVRVAFEALRQFVPEVRALGLGFSP